LRSLFLIFGQNRAHLSLMRAAEELLKSPREAGTEVLIRVAIYPARRRRRRDPQAPAAFRRKYHAEIRAGDFVG
jgi:hypothetical protein